MLQALWSASSGMLAQQMAMDDVSNNMANVNTFGYKRSRVDFQDLLYSQIREPGKVTRAGQVVPNGIQIGSGSRPASSQMIFVQGSLQETGNPTDLAISGDAFFEVLLPDGTKAYTRDGSFRIDADGYLVNADGRLTNMEAIEGGLLTFLAGATSVNIDGNGNIIKDKQLATLEQYSFSSIKDLEEVEPGVFKSTDLSGDPTLLSDLKADADNLIDGAGNPLPSDEKPIYSAFYQIMLPDGETAYTNESNLKVDQTGRLVTGSNGYPLEPEVTVPIQAQGGTLTPGSVAYINKDGIINASTEAGKLNLVKFTNPAGLEKLGSNLYVPTVNSGQPQVATDYQLQKGFLEVSNVDMVEEMVTMMIAQRAYEFSSRSIKTSDEMLALANGLLRR